MGTAASGAEREKDTCGTCEFLKKNSDYIQSTDLTVSVSKSHKYVSGIQESILIF